MRQDLLYNSWPRTLFNKIIIIIYKHVTSLFVLIFLNVSNYFNCENVADFNLSQISRQNVFSRKFLYFNLQQLCLCGKILFIVLIMINSITYLKGRRAPNFCKTIVLVDINILMYIITL